ncbi:zinc-regulated TonB-dependent outer membrane receptor [Halorhodospira abdelmalekii]|uniref:zinc-regulated TonB-dependent outer membrane receptor n=1 Tax=Halorhodospira abdelmalekii TaxID=421629 RepID=UPI001906F759|nr:zinc-regulated TonB-dependent outer membrane receptor [Halorhodospira abdelmalekii]MBK1736087.1 zinc-regulated TonB-dependent outer membrane receptor [Halorhodospira abdelmalekii]
MRSTDTLHRHATKRRWPLAVTLAAWPLALLTLSSAYAQMPQDRAASHPHLEAHQQHLGGAPAGRASSEQVGAGTLMNPLISVIFDGVYANEFSGHIDDPGGFEMGHDHGDNGHDHGFEDGFQLRETEFAFEATVDPYFDAFAMLVIEGTDTIDLEEAYFTTRALPWGLQIKGGRFLSNIGYINPFHPHDWDFVDRPLVSEHLFGDHGLQDTGIQVNWLAPTLTYLKFGVEALQGDDDGMLTKYGHSAGPNLMTAFAKWGPDLGFDHAAQLGLSAGYGTIWEDEERHSTDMELWEDGHSWFAGLDAVYKYTPPRSYQGAGQLTLQGEWFYREISADYIVYSHTERDDGSWRFGEGRGDPDNINSAVTWQQDGMYLQAVYGIAPRWRAGLRAEALGLLKNQSHNHRTAGPNCYDEFDTSYRYSAVVTHYPSEFSFVRGQLSYSDFAADEPGGPREDAWQFLVQYNLSLGVHGAHTF